MAGGKETPRQKLIGLMYLVLLAMLALQVSSAILQKFQFLNASLEQGVKNASALNETKIGAIEKAVEKAPKYKPILDEAKLVKKEAGDMIAYIDGLKQEVIKATGGLDENGNYVGLKDEDKIANFMVGDPSTGKKGKAFEMKDRLNKFVNDMNAEHKVSFPLLALDGEDDPLTNKDAEQKNKDFAELNFSHTPMIAGLAVLSDKQTRIANMEAEILNKLASQVGAKDIKFDQISVAVSAKSSTVAAGTDYEADMFITATSSAIVPTMKFRGSSLKVEDGKGKIKFRAQATNYDKEGNSKQTADASVTIPKPTGDGDTTFSVKVEYVVAKPVIDVKSAAVSALYLNCGNPLNIQVPALGASYKPSFSASGASVITGGEKGQITVVPSSTGTVSINVASEGSAIGKVEFPVRKIPRPQVVVKVNGSPVDLKKGLTAPGPASLQVDAEPEPNFAAALPKEARYRIAAGEILLARGKRPLGTVQISSNLVSVSNLRNQAQSGDRYVIEVKTVQRKNFRDAIEDVPMPSSASIIVVPIN
jgi:gliding motility-associated protein GldM